MLIYFDHFSYFPESAEGIGVQSKHVPGLTPLDFQNLQELRVLPGYWIHVLLPWRANSGCPECRSSQRQCEYSVTEVHKVSFLSSPLRVDFLVAVNKIQNY